MTQIQLFTHSSWRVTLMAMQDLGTRVRAFCKAHHLKLNTDLGQHFLVDETVLEAMTGAADVHADEHVVEIGPGIGVLTRVLLERTARVTAIELDPRFPPLIREYVRFNGSSLPLPTVIQANALEVPFPTTPYKIVANIPYHITSPLLRHAFMEGTHPPTSLTLLIQREVAEKICDRKDLGLLSIVVQIFGTARLVRTVPPACFLPPPKVDSAVLHIDCHAKPLVENEILGRLMTLAKIAFGGKRKMLRNTLLHIQGMEVALHACAIDPTRRPQTLTIEEWIALAHTWKPSSSPIE